MSFCCIFDLFFCSVDTEGIHPARITSQLQLRQSIRSEPSSSSFSSSISKVLNYFRIQYQSNISILQILSFKFCFQNLKQKNKKQLQFFNQDIFLILPLFSQIFLCFFNNKSHRIFKIDAIDLLLFLIKIIKSDQAKLSMNEDTVRSVNKKAYRYHDVEQEESQDKEVIYQNRIFNINKKYNVSLNKEYSEIKQSQLQIKHQSSFTCRFKSKPSEVFGKYCDVIERNKSLLRRGVCDRPFKIDCSHQWKANKLKEEIKPPRVFQLERKHIKTQIGNKPLERHKHLYNILRSNRQKKDKDYSKMSLSQRNQQKKWNKKSFTAVNQHMTERNDILHDKVKAKNSMNRKLALQMIHYSMLGQWIKQSLIS